MNIKGLIITGISFMILSLFSCGGEKIERPDAILSPEQVQANQSSFESPTINSGTITGVRHYTCPNGHEGSDTQGACIVCGATLVHNQAFHDQPPAEREPPQNSTGVWHYICPNGHAGGSGSATACVECGTTLIHNQAYHNQAAPGTSPPPNPAPNQSLGIQDVPPPPTATPPTPEPAQNAAGVWHYICPNGHPGGAGSAIACSDCGTVLVHNQAYHN